MIQEIEDFIDKNINEMHKEINELKFSFEQEIKNIDRNYLLFIF